MRGPFLDAARQAQRLREQAHDLGLVDAVEFAGPKAFGRELFAYYRRADLFVLPSHMEGTPRVLIEAMAFGLPVVATDVGGIPDLIANGRNGRLVAARDPDSMSRAILELARDTKAYEAIALRNRSQARAFSVEKLAAKMASFIAAETRNG